MMEGNVDIIVALIMGIVAPLLIQLITRQLKKLEEKKQNEIKSVSETPAIERSLRDELRSESERQRLRALALEDALEESNRDKEKALKELSEWQSAFYRVQTEKSRIEYELAGVRQELNTVKQQLVLLQQTKESINGLNDGK